MTRKKFIYLLTCLVLFLLITSFNPVCGSDRIVLNDHDPFVQYPILEQSSMLLNDPKTSGRDVIPELVKGNQIRNTGRDYSKISSLSSQPIIIPITSAYSGGLIINHTHTNITKIPLYWRNQVKDLSLHFAHTSHGSQIVTGLEYLENQDPNLNFDITYGDNPPRLPDDTSALRIYDGNNIPGGDTYITPELYWEGTSGIDNTRSVSNTGLFNYSIWSWCGQASYYSEESITQYLTALNQLESQYPGMRFIYMTGHTDGGSSDLERNNNLIRQYAINNNKILFDFNDIEMYSPDGNGPYYNDGEGYCEWCDAWCTAHPEQCTCFDECMGDCAHTHKLFCKLKANAFWWMMARLAGWSGMESPTITSITPSSGVNTGPVSITNLAGTNFVATGQTTVKLSKAGQTDIVATDVMVISANQITCQFPITGKSIGSWNIVVTTGGQTVTKANGFTITAPVPTISSLSPPTGVNTGSLAVTITGTNFATGTNTVNLTKSGQTNITATNVNRVSPTQITCTLPLSGKVTGPWNVVLTTGGQTVTKANGFTITAPVPTISSLSPPTGVNTGSLAVTITGTNFVTGTNTVNLTKSGQTNITATTVSIHI